MADLEVMEREKALHRHHVLRRLAETEKLIERYRRIPGYQGAVNAFEQRRIELRSKLARS